MTLTQQITDWVAGMLSGDEILIPARQLWRMSLAAGLLHRLTAEDFVGLLEDDERFEIMPDDDEIEDEMDAELEAELEELGFFSGPLVKLADREITAEYLARKMQESTDELLNALRSAWEFGQDSEDISEEEFLEVWDAAQQLRDEIQNVVGEMLADSQDDGEEE